MQLSVQLKVKHATLRFRTDLQTYHFSVHLHVILHGQFQIARRFYTVEGQPHPLTSKNWLVKLVKHFLKFKTIYVK